MNVAERRWHFACDRGREAKKVKAQKECLVTPEVSLSNELLLKNIMIFSGPGSSKRTDIRESMESLRENLKLFVYHVFAKPKDEETSIVATLN